MDAQLLNTATRWISILISLSAGLAVFCYGIYIRLGRSKQYFLRESKGLLRPAVYHALPLLGIVLCLVGVAGLPGDVETRQRLFIYLVTPSLIITLLIVLTQPSWLKPGWLTRLQKRHPDIYPFLREVAREEVGHDRGKAAAWAEAMDSGHAQEEWVARVRKRRGWPTRELHAAEQPSIKVPRRFRQRIARVQQLPPSSGGLEEQIVIYEEILSQLKCEQAPAFWAAVQNKLGMAYAARRRGNRAENLEKAIAAYEAACAVTRERGLVIDWAMAQNNLGAAYRKRTQGDKAENLERVIAAYESALEVFTREQFPSYWAGTQSSLGFAYFKRVRGDRKENLDQAIAAYERALEVYTEEHPEQRRRVREQLEKAVRAREQV